MRRLGTLEVLGAVGVVVPSATAIAPVLTPLAACCLVGLVGGAAEAVLDLKESPTAPTVVRARCLFVALGLLGWFG